MPDPKLKEAMAEIMAVIRKHDIAASVLIENENNAEFLYELSPSWSCISIEQDGRVRVKAQAKTGGDAEKERLRVSIGLIMGILDHAKKQQDDMTMLVDMLIKNGVQFNHWSKQE
jgi:hypothetical protein